MEIARNLHFSAAPVRFLALGSKIVGVQHYDGVVSDRESVVLRRQPANIYDPNAIQVERLKPFLN